MLSIFPAGPGSRGGVARGSVPGEPRPVTVAGRGGHVALVVVLAVLLAACGDDPEEAPVDPGDATEEPTDEEVPAGEPEAPAEDEEVVVVDGGAFETESLQVPVGTTVTWVNDDSFRHTATSGEPGESDGTFDVDLPANGGSGSYVADEPGTFVYHCSIHPNMVAELVVE